MRRARWLLPLLVLGGAYWILDATTPDHDAPHGTPITMEQAESFARGTFISSTGETNLVTGVECEPGEDGKGEEPNVHFRCEIHFADGDPLNRLVHVLQQGELLIND